MFTPYEFWLKARRKEKSDEKSCCMTAVMDLPLCLGVLKHKAPLARGGGGIFLPKNAVCMADLI